MTIRGGGHPKQAMVLNTGFENGSAAEELRRRCAWMHHGQVVMDLPDTRLRREFLVPDSELPSDRSAQPQRACRRARGLSRRGPETMERETSAERRPALIVPARAGLQHRGSGRRNGIPSRTKKRGDEESKNIVNVVMIVLDFEGLIQGLLGVHSRYGLHTRAVSNL
jgi:hypothetical protein